MAERADRVFGRSSGQTGGNHRFGSIEAFHDWARRKGLRPSEAQYLRRTPGGIAQLQFTSAGDASTGRFSAPTLLRLQRRNGKMPRTQYQRTRASISLQYGDTIGVRLPASPSAGLQSIAGDSSAAKDGVRQAVSRLVTRDERTNRAVLSIPLPGSVTQDRIAGAVSALFGAFARASESRTKVAYPSGSASGPEA